MDKFKERIDILKKNMVKGGAFHSEKEADDFFDEIQRDSTPRTVHGILSKLEEGFTGKVYQQQGGTEKWESEDT